MATAAQHASFWSEDRWRREYGWRPPAGQANPYKPKGYHRALDIAAWVGPVPALSAGIIADTGFGTGIGHWVAVQVDPGVFHGYCHLYGGAGLPKVGSFIGRGGDLPRLAQVGENPGSAWSGPHLHFIVTTSASGVPNAGSPDTDPAPIIRAELTGAAGEGGEEFNPMPTPEEYAQAVWYYALNHPVTGKKVSAGIFLETVPKYFEEAAGKVWAHPLTRPDGVAPTPAGTLLAYEPLEHKQAKAEITRLSTMVAALGAAVESIASGSVSAEQVQQIADAAQAAARDGAEAAVAVAHAAEMTQLEAILGLAVTERDAKIAALEAELRRLAG